MWSPSVASRPAAVLRSSMNRTLASSSHASAYLQGKKEAKQRRRQLYNRSIERRDKLPQRRAQQKQERTKSNAFRAWFDDKKVGEEVMERKCRQKGLDWRIQVAVILERGNVVQPDKEDWEIEYDKMQAQVELYRGKDYPKEFATSVDESKVAMTDEELMELLPPGYEPAPRVTADEDNLQSTNRKLKTNIYLTVRDDEQWRFPTVDVKSDETLLEAARRRITEQLGEQVDYWSISNSPLAVDMEAFEEPVDGLYGRKTFFLKVYYDEGKVSGSSDYAWLDREEIVERVRGVQGDRMAKFYHYLL